MFIGHFGVALAAKKVAPRTSLGTLVMAAQFVDLLWPVFLLLGVERVIIAPGTTAVTPLDFISYPLSHSLLADLGWACLFAGIYKMVKRDSRGAVCLWFVVISHWLLDALSHQPDLPLYPGSSTYIGLGLWNSRLWTILVEGAIFVIGARLYAEPPIPATAPEPLPSGHLSPCCSSFTSSTFSARRHPARRPSPFPLSVCGCSSFGPTGWTATGWPVPLAHVLLSYPLARLPSSLLNLEAGS